MQQLKVAFCIFSTTRTWCSTKQKAFHFRLHVVVILQVPRHAAVHCHFLLAFISYSTRPLGRCIIFTTMMMMMATETLYSITSYLDTKELSSKNLIHHTYHLHVYRRPLAAQNRPIESTTNREILGRVFSSKTNSCFASQKNLIGIQIIRISCPGTQLD